MIICLSCTLPKDFFRLNTHMFRSHKCLFCTLSCWIILINRSLPFIVLIWWNFSSITPHLYMRTFRLHRWLLHFTIEHIWCTLRTISLSHNFIFCLFDIIIVASLSKFIFICIGIRIKMQISYFVFFHVKFGFRI